MSTFRSRFLRAASLFAMSSMVVTMVHAAAQPIAEPQDLDADLLAKIAKERAKGNAQQSLDRRLGQNPFGVNPDPISDGCGNIGIGNVFSGGAPGFQPPREVTVIVTGDIVSVNNRCR